MSINLRPCGDLVRVGPSAVHGLGVFANREIRKHICVTAYPSDLMEVIVAEYSEQKRRISAFFSRAHAHHDTENNRRLKSKLFDYGLDMGSVSVYGDPAKHSSGACGHMINDPRNTESDAN